MRWKERVALARVAAVPSQCHRASQACPLVHTPGHAKQGTWRHARAPTPGKGLGVQYP